MPRKRTADRTSRGIYRPERWRYPQFLAALALLTAGIASTRDAWSELVRAALGNGGVLFGTLAVGTAAWLAWVRRHRLQICTVEHRAAGLLLVAIGGALYAVGRGEPMLFCTGGLTMALGCLVAALGTDVLRRFGPPLAALFFLVPLPAALTAPATKAVLLTAVRWTEEISAFFGTGAVEELRTISENPIFEAIPHAVLVTSFAFAFAAPFQLRARLLFLLVTPLVIAAAEMGLLGTLLWLARHEGPAAPHLYAGAMLSAVVADLAFLKGLDSLLFRTVWPVRRYRLACD